MRPDTGTGITVAPGLGLGWTRVARAVANDVSLDRIDRIWLFAPVRSDDREWGTAVVSCRTDSGRRRVYTASYLMVIRGRARGQGRVVVEEVGESPIAVVHEVIAGVRERAGEPAPPVEVFPELWYGGDDCRDAYIEGEGAPVGGAVGADAAGTEPGAQPH